MEVAAGRVGGYSGSMKRAMSWPLGTESLRTLASALERLEGGFAELPTGEAAEHKAGDLVPVLMEVADRLKDNYPYFHPFYAGQMLKPPHPVAQLAYLLAMSLNPNNHALDGGRASSRMEREAVAELAGLFGWTRHLGHLCSGGTMANLEALWIAGQLRPGEKIVASSQAHYTHGRISHVLGLGFESIPCDRRARMDVDALRKRLAQGGVGTVVATAGSTATGSVDPLPAILELRTQYDFRLHVDAAYGGYFRLVDDLAPSTRASLASLGEADSLVVDPHKHGLQPYGCGCVLFRDPTVGRFYKHDSPYTYFTSADLHLGEITLECSRPGAAAVALWATQRLLPLVQGGAFALQLGQSRAAARGWHEKLRNDPRFLTAFEPELDIVIWIPRAARMSQATELARRVFTEAARRGLHLALAQLPVEFFELEAEGIEPDSPTVTCLRSVLMKPEHHEWLDRIWAVLDQAVQAARNNGTENP
jgi:tyrosine decarboxylase/aspartate 1-decarboxylase